MSHNDEHTPIRERWTARPAGQDDEATAGALLRTAAEHGPLGEKRLSEIHTRLRRSRRARAFPRPAPRLLRHLVFAAGFVLCAGVLSASVMHVMRRPPKQPEVAPAPADESHKKAPRRPVGKRAPVEVVTPTELPAAPAPDLSPPIPSPAPAAGPPAPTPTPPGPSAPPATPVLSPTIQAQASAPRASGSHRRIAIRETPNPGPMVTSIEPTVPSPIVTSALPVPAKPSTPLAPAALALPPIPQAPAERPAPTLLPTPVLPAPTPVLPAPAPVRSEPSRLARESRWLASAIAKLRQERQPEQALAILDQHHAELGSGALAAEANATRIEALLRLGRNAQALNLLDGKRLSAQGLEREMLVARAELRAERGRISAALQDFTMILSVPGRVDGITERALFGRATCRAKSGDSEGARGDFTQYLNAFPQGRFSQEARSALAQQLR